MAGVTYPADTTENTYRTTLCELPTISRSLRLLWGEEPSAEVGTAWALSLPHDLTDGRKVNAPAEAHPPNSGFQKLFVADPGEAHRHHLAQVFGIRTGEDALQAANDRINGAGSAEYRELHTLLCEVCSTPLHERPPAYSILAPVAADQHHIVIPFLQPEATLALPEVPPSDTTAWDISVAVRLLWLAHGGGLVTAEQCEPVVLRALELARRTYGGWSEYADGLVVGRAVSNGRLDDSGIHFVDDVAVALNHPDSLWSRVALQG